MAEMRSMHMAGIWQPLQRALCAPLIDSMLVDLNNVYRPRSSQLDLKGKSEDMDHSLLTMRQDKIAHLS